MARIKNPNHARAIRRGIEYTRRELEARTESQYALAVMQNDRYWSYLGWIESRLMRRASLHTAKKILATYS